MPKTSNQGVEVPEYIQNNLIREQVLASLSRSAGKYMHGMTEDAIHREMRASVGYSCPVSDIRVHLVQLHMEGLVRGVTLANKTFYQPNPSGQLCSLDGGVVQHRAHV
jgi:hypothetical protein